MSARLRNPVAEVEMQLARLEVNLDLIVDYAKLMHTTLIEVKALQCLIDIEEIKKQLNTPN
jgi:hypothetical protein